MQSTKRPVKDLGSRIIRSRRIYVYGPALVAKESRRSDSRFRGGRAKALNNAARFKVEV